METITKWLRSLGQMDAIPGNPIQTGASETPESSLYHCPCCEDVYIATEKHRCRTCETPVEQVPSTLAEV